MSSVVLIEDDAAVRQAIERALTGKGYLVRTAATALDGVTATATGAPDVVILDLGLPDLDGTQALRMIRVASAVPVIVATARDDENEIVRVLDAGADDYLVKPFSIGQLDARIRAVLRRARSGEEGATTVVGGLVVDRRTREATLDGRPLDLTKREFDLLAYLAARAGQVVQKRQIMTDVWRQPYGGADKTVDVHLSWLRRKLGETAAAPRRLHTVRGIGVRLVDPDAVPSRTGAPGQ